MLESPMITVASENLGKATKLDAEGRYIEFCKHAISAPLILKGMKIVMDCANGATYKVGPSVFEELGATVIRMGNEPNGLNINVECGSTHPEKLQQKVLECQADLGIAFDGDGDRVVMVDEKGESVDGDEMVFIIASGRASRGALEGPVVGTLMSNLGMEVALRQKGIPFLRSKVGDRYVLELLREHGGIIGGESSGHILCLDRTTTGDGIISALQVVELMVAKGMPLSQLKQGMEKYPQKMINVSVKKNQTLNEAASVWNEVKQVETSLGQRGRVLIRPSGTEPLVRVMVEGEDADEVTRCAEKLAQVVSEALG
jgi:phosphoglucosamine mutase